MANLHVHDLRSHLSTAHEPTNTANRTTSTTPSDSESIQTILRPPVDAATNPHHNTKICHRLQSPRRLTSTQAKALDHVDDANYVEGANPCDQLRKPTLPWHGAFGSST